MSLTSAICLAIATAVLAASPVTMATLIPAVRSDVIAFFTPLQLVGGSIDE